MTLRAVTGGAEAIEVSNKLREDLANDTDSSLGAAIVGYDGDTVQAVLDEAKPMQSYTALRNYTGRAKGVRITQPGIAGIFQRDDSDVTTDDDGGVTIVDGAGRRWKRLMAGEINPLWWGARGYGVTDDSDALQAMLNFMKNTADLVLPGTSLQYRNLTRKVNLLGRVYKIGKGLIGTGCHGVVLTNGTIFADAQATWEEGSCVLYAQGCWGFGISDDVTIQCNGVTNGLDFQSGANWRFSESKIFGWGNQEFGFRMGPQGYSSGSKFVGNRISGWITHSNELPQSERTAIGCDMQGNDWIMMGSIIDSCLYPVKITGGGFQFIGNHPWNGDTSNPSATGPDPICIYVATGSGGVISGNYVDNGAILIEGPTLYKTINDNWFITNLDELDACIILRPTSANQQIADLQATGNHWHGSYDRFIKIDDTQGGFSSLARSIVTDNTQRSSRDGYGAQPSAQCETRGTARVYVTHNDFDNDVATVDLSDVLLLPITTTESINFQIGIQYNSQQITDIDNGVQWSRYDGTTGKLKVKVQAAFVGYLQINFDQSWYGNQLTPEPAA